MKLSRNILTLAALLTLTAPALALFEVKDPLSKMYNTGSKAVFSGTITAINSDAHLLTVKPETAFKGEMPEAIQIQIVAPESLQTQVKTNQPVIIFQGAQSAAIHIADHWYIGQPLSKPGNYRIKGALGKAAHTSHDESFPGKTADLIKALAEIKAGKSTLLDLFPDLKLPPVQKVAALPANAAAFAALELPGDKSPTFFVAAPDGLKVFTYENAKTKDITASLSLPDAKPTKLSAAMINHKPTLLLAEKLYDFTDKKFTPIPNPAFPKERTFAATLLPEKDQPAIVFVTPKGLLRQTLGADSLDDDLRLTGTKLTDYHRAHATGFTSATLVSLDLNHDDRPDLLLLTPEGTLTLLNRGFGGFLVSKDFAASLVPPPSGAMPAPQGSSAAPATGAAPLIASTGQTLWLLQADGTLSKCDFSAK